ncbi:MAG: putative Fe-S cluster assembly protein SufT [Deltaproteobacteria bacterium]|nr:putative Fe-S cluster assembly protein SufT [Deltaproteobacteria bacterium]
MREEALLKNDVEATVVPDGHKITLYKDTYVTITQALGGSFTVMTDRGQMARIAGKDAAALGKTLESIIPAPGAQHTSRDLPIAVITVDEKVWEQLKTCYDPEIPVDIVNLGLVYDCQVTKLADDQYEVSIKMTLTAPGCGMGDILKQDVESKVLGIQGVKTVQVEMVFEPVWDQSRMSEEAKVKLGMM